MPDDAGIRDVDHEAALSVWADYLGDRQPFVLVSSVDRARRLLMQAAGVAAGEIVGLPAHCRRAQSEAVKRSGGTPRFYDLLPDLSVDPESPGLDQMRVLWSMPIAGTPCRETFDKVVLVDYSDSLPAPGALAVVGSGAATVWGLHIGKDGERNTEGALISFADAQMHAAVVAAITDEDLPDPGRALAQCERLRGEDGLAARYMRVLKEAQIGLDIGAGLPMEPSGAICALPLGLTVRIPAEADVGTFISYVRNENIVVNWMPEYQPMFYVSYQITDDRGRRFRSAANLAHWIISPLGPDFDDDQIVHSVLGLLKAAEYTGVRWYTDIERAAWYGNLMLEWYGPTHDAYRPAFLQQSEDGEYLAALRD